MWIWPKRWTESLGYGYVKAVIIRILPNAQLDGQFGVTAHLIFCIKFFPVKQIENK